MVDGVYIIRLEPWKKNNYNYEHTYIPNHQKTVDGPSSVCFLTLFITFSPFFEIAAKVSSFFEREIVAGPGDFIGKRAGYLGGAMSYIRVLIGTSGMGITIAGVGILGFLFLFSRLNKQVFLFL